MNIHKYHFFIIIIDEQIVTFCFITFLVFFIGILLMHMWSRMDPQAKKVRLWWLGGKKSPFLVVFMSDFLQTNHKE